MAAPGHCVDVFLTVFIETVDGLQQFFRRQLFFLQHHAVALFLEGTGIQNLVAAAGVGRQGISRLGFASALISQIALAPAREMIRSARQKDPAVPF